MEDKREEYETPSLFVKCECAAEALEIAYWEDDKEFFISFWDIGRRRVSWIPWKKRFEIIWRIIRGKDLYSDMVILDHKSAKQAVDFINEILEKDVQSNSTKN